MMLFFIGVLEMIIISVWTKTVSETKVVVSGVVTLINVVIWYYVLQEIVNDISNWQLIALYAVGCAIGTMATTLFYKIKETKNKAKRALKTPKSVEAVC